MFHSHAASSRTGAHPFGSLQAGAICEMTAAVSIFATYRAPAGVRLIGTSHAGNTVGFHRPTRR